MGGMVCPTICLVMGAALVACGSPSVGSFPPIDENLAAQNEAQGDPHARGFSYEEAMAGLAPGVPVAVLVTSLGEVHCSLAIDTAPLTAANFIGLARGRRAFQVEAEGPWISEPFYADLPWHRALQRQFVQTGLRGERERPGFRLQDERSIGDAFDGPGVLAMANDGTPHSGGAQFFVTSSELRGLDGQYAIFGRCSDHALIQRLERDALAGGPNTPRLLSVRIEVPTP